MDDIKVKHQIPENREETPTDGNNDKKKIFEKKLKKFGLSFLSFAKNFVLIVLIVIFVRVFVVQPYYVIGSSMEPTFHNSEYLFVDEISYRFADIKRGDVTVFKHPDESCIGFVETSPILKTFFQGPCKNYIKRVIGLPGETVILSEGKIKITSPQDPDGFILDEGYIEEDITTYGDQEVTIGEKEYFVLGDNRKPNASSDSREWGLLPRDYIIGRAALRLIPLDGIGLVGKYSD